MPELSSALNTTFLSPRIHTDSFQRFPPVTLIEGRELSDRSTRELVITRPARV